MLSAATGREAMLLELGLELEEARPFARITDPARTVETAETGRTGEPG